MKTRILALALALILLVSALPVSVSAASKSDVYNYLKNIALQGMHDTDIQAYHDDLLLSSSDSIYFSVYYWEESKNVEVTIFSSKIGFEVTVVLPTSMKVPYAAYVMVYDEQSTTGTVNVAAAYNGAKYTKFVNFTGNTQLKSAMLELLNNFLPAVLEFTRAVINENNYALRDMGLTGYNACHYVHAYDKGKVTTKPTCVEYGTMTYTCRVCGDKRTEGIDPTGVHTWDKGTVFQGPTCTEAGVMRYTCTVCKTYTRDEPIAALGHAWKLTETLTEPAEGEKHGTARFTCTRCGETKDGKLCAAEVFTDMPKERNWAHDPIDWAYFNGITAGKTATTFGTKDTVTRGEVMTFLWTALDRPAHNVTESPFTDVKSGKYYYNPVLWAVENGITSGRTSTTFAPKGKCTRAEIVTFLWCAAGKPAPETTENPFEDVKEGKYYYNAVLWAVENGITAGKSATTFGPRESCTRAQTVTFLYKAYDLIRLQEEEPEFLGSYVPEAPEETFVP